MHSAIAPSAGPRRSAPRSNLRRGLTAELTPATAASPAPVPAKRIVISLVALAAALLSVLVLAGCSDEPATGPVQIHYGRDTCDLCRMIISDPRFAAQIRGGPGHKAYKFDDIGDALIYLGRQTWKDDADVEFWVMDVEKGKSWLDARKAHYMSGMQSPMAHGFGAYADPRPGSIDFQALRAAAAKRAASLLCRPEVEPKQSRMQKVQ